MAPFELLLLSALVATSAALPTATPMLSYRGLTTGFKTKPSQSNKQGQHALATNLQDSSSSYQCFDGTDTDLSPNTWLPFDDLWRINEPTVLSKNGGDTYIRHYIKEALHQVSSESDVDARLLLTLMMQEVRHSTITFILFFMLTDVTSSPQAA